MAITKSSRYRGVCWWAARKKWRLQISAAKVHLLCETELEAGMLYNAVARKLWPGCRLNSTPVSLDGDFIIQRWGRVFRLDTGIYGIVDQDRTELTPVSYLDLVRYEWFYRDGKVCRATYNPVQGNFTLQTMHEFIFGGPCVHRNGRQLDNRMSNLRDPEVAPAALPGEQDMTDPADYLATFEPEEPPPAP